MERGINAAIDDMEDAFKFIEHYQDQVTLPQFRKLKMLRFKFANWLVAAVKAETPELKDGEG